jgi:hypothetical protein
MIISRRLFTQAGLSTGALLAVNPSYSALETQLIQRHIPSSGEAIPVIGVGTNRYGVGDDQNARTTLKEALKKFHELGYDAEGDTSEGMGGGKLVRIGAG